MTNEKNLEKRIWRVMPVEAHSLPYADRLAILSSNFNFNGEQSSYKMPVPETKFEKEVYAQFQDLINSYDLQRIEYVVPLIKEFVIDNKTNEAALLFRYQMDFAIGKGFQMKEIIFHGKQGEKLKEVYEDHAWTGPSPLDYTLSGMAKINLDPMLYLLRGNILAYVPNPDFHGLEMGKKEISFSPEYGEKKIVNIKK